MRVLGRAFDALSGCASTSDRTEQSNFLAQLVQFCDKHPGQMRLRHLANHLAIHNTFIDGSALPSLLGDSERIEISSEQCQEFDLLLQQKLLPSNTSDPAIPFNCNKRINFHKLFSDAIVPLPAEASRCEPRSSFNQAPGGLGLYQHSNAFQTETSSSNLLPQIAGIKRLGTRAPVVLPQPSKSCDNTGGTEEDDDEYEPDPKIRAKKQWKKQYAAMKQKEAEKRYNTPKVRDDSDQMAFAHPSFNASQSNQKLPFVPPKQQSASLNVDNGSLDSQNAPRQLGNRPGFRSAGKFVVPKANRDQENVGHHNNPPKTEMSGQGAVKENFIKKALNSDVEEPTDERLKGLDPAMIEMIVNEIVDKSGKVEWDDVAGLEKVKENIMEVIVWPMLRPDLFNGVRGPPKGLLLFGPPGTGKTMIGKCIASQCNATFFSISASSLLSKWYGEAEKMVRTLFAVARTRQPAVIFIDEVDSLLTKRGSDENECSRRIKTEFLVQLDGVTCGENDRILMIGATNLPNELDEAARRRFGKRLYVTLPGLTARIQMVKRVMGKMDAGQTALSEEDFEEIGKRSEGFSGSDMSHLCREASMGPLRSIRDIKKATVAEVSIIGEELKFMQNVLIEQIRPVELKDFIAAFQAIRPSVAPKDLVELEAWNCQYGTINST